LDKKNKEYIDREWLTFIFLLFGLVAVAVVVVEQVPQDLLDLKEILVQQGLRAVVRVLLVSRE
jgi:hypothetical protein